MKLQVDTFLIKLQYLMLVGIVVTQILGMNAVTSLLFTGTFLLTVCIWLVAARSGIDMTGILGLMMIGLSFISVMVNVLQTNAPLSFSYVKKMIMFWSAILLFDAMRHYQPDEKLIRFVLRINTLLCFVFIAAFYGMRDLMHLFGGRVGNYLTFRFDNPNLTGVMLVSICMFQMLAFSFSRSVPGKLMHSVLILYMFSFIFGTRSRNSMLMICLFAVLFLFLSVFRRTQFTVTGKVAFLVSAAPLIFAAVYLLLVNTPWVRETFAFFSGEGKELNSRSILWNYAAENIFRFPVFGAYYQLAYESEAPHMHNTHLDVAVSYGVPVLILTCIFLYRILREGGKNCRSRMNLICLISFACLLLSGLGESMLFTGSLGVYIYAGLFLMFAYCDFGEKQYGK